MSGNSNETPRQITSFLLYNTNKMKITLILIGLIIGLAVKNYTKKRLVTHPFGTMIYTGKILGLKFGMKIGEARKKIKKQGLIFRADNSFIIGLDEQRITIPTTNFKYIGDVEIIFRENRLDHFVIQIKDTLLSNKELHKNILYFFENEIGAAKYRDKDTQSYACGWPDKTHNGVIWLNYDKKNNYVNIIYLK